MNILFAVGLTSSYCSTMWEQHFDARGRPIMSRPYTEYPWSPRWEPSQMAQRILYVSSSCEFLIEIIVFRPPAHFSLIFTHLFLSSICAASLPLMSAISSKNTAMIYFNNIVEVLRCELEFLALTGSWYSDQYWSREGKFIHPGCPSEDRKGSDTSCMHGSVSGGWWA